MTRKKGTKIRRLKELADVFTGVRSRPGRKGEQITLLKKVDSDSLVLDKAQLVEGTVVESVDGVRDEAMLRRGDVVVLARGERFWAWVVGTGATGIYAGEPFLVARPKRGTSPVLLAWSLRRSLEMLTDPEGPNAILSASVLREMPVVWPTRQDEGEELLMLWEEEREKVLDYLREREAEVQWSLLRNMEPILVKEENEQMEALRQLYGEEPVFNSHLRRTLYGNHPGISLWQYPAPYVVPRLMDLMWDRASSPVASVVDAMAILLAWVEFSNGRGVGEVGPQDLSTVLENAWDAGYLDGDHYEHLSSLGDEDARRLLRILKAIYEIVGEERDILITQAELGIEYGTLRGIVEEEEGVWRGDIVPMAIADSMVELFLATADVGDSVLMTALDPVLHLEFARRGIRTYVLAENDSTEDWSVISMLSSLLDVPAPEPVSPHRARNMDTGAVVVTPSTRLDRRQRRTLLRETREELDGLEVDGGVPVLLGALYGIAMDRPALVVGWLRDLEIDPESLNRGWISVVMDLGPDGIVSAEPPYDVFGAAAWIMKPQTGDRVFVVGPWYELADAAYWVARDGWEEALSESSGVRQARPSDLKVSHCDDCGTVILNPQEDDVTSPEMYRDRVLETVRALTDVGAHLERIRESVMKMFFSMEGVE